MHLRHLSGPPTALAGYDLVLRLVAGILAYNQGLDDPLFANGIT
ncbi:hypothetical protein SAMN04488026_100738 [Aliiruegeria lutimaris]|uniref:Uncharacterized protein n=1 Tax=Aliiruegeria lutimaris TaxID=571298 RepID=A0A1G8NE56_9RHOB|nr:hypothetical protein SAMN04488026_100738 [Aliiruegeria lutimaris]